MPLQLQLAQSGASLLGSSTEREGSVVTVGRRVGPMGAIFQVRVTPTRVETALRQLAAALAHVSLLEQQAANLPAPPIQ